MKAIHSGDGSMKNRIIITFMLFILTQGGVLAQMAGNPVGSQGGEWSMGLSTSILKHDIGDYSTESQRHVLKSTWSILPFMDFYVLAGGVGLKMESSDQALEPYKGNFRIGMGTGFNMNLLDDKTAGFGLWVDGHVFRFTSQGSYKELQMIHGNSYDREHKLYYDWREFRCNAGITIPVKRVKFYAAGSLMNIWRKDIKKEYLDDGETQTYLGEKKDEYKSGNWTGGLAGIEISLPDRYQLSVEVLGFNKKNYQIMVGISQVGISQW